MSLGGRSYMDLSEGFQGRAINAAGAHKSIQEDPGKTAGGAIGATAGMATAGAVVGPALSTGASAGPVGALIGAGVGLLSYLLS